jgi:hypothetical protein
MVIISKDNEFISYTTYRALKQPGCQGKKTRVFTLFVANPVEIMSEKVAACNPFLKDYRRLLNILKH